MEKKFTFNVLTSNKKYSRDQKELIIAIREAMEEINRTMMYFEFVNDPKLIDYAIYMQEAAKSRYIYLINEAKKVGLTVEEEFLFTNVG